MVSIIIPTYNRSFLIKRIIPSYLIQKDVAEVIIIDDNSSDDTSLLIQELITEYSDDKLIYIRNQSNIGAAAAKIKGAKIAKSKFILFGEDDALLGIDYVSNLLKLYRKSENLGVISGRIIYKKEKQSNEDAKCHFGIGLNKYPTFNKKRFGYNWESIFEGDIEVPFTHSIFLTTKDKFLMHACDDYSKGNQFREETAFQLEVFLKGMKNVITDTTYCYHLNRKEITCGGQNSNRIKKFYWSNYNTWLFYKRYFNEVKELVNIKYGIKRAMFIFCLYEFFILFIRPLRKLLK